MELNHILGIDSGVELLRNGCFDSLCNLTTETTINCLSYANNEAFIKMAYKKNNISCLIVPYEYKTNSELLEGDKGVLLSKNPKCTFHLIHNFFCKAREKSYLGGTFFSTVIGENCSIHDSAIIAKKNVVIGNNVTIEENVVIREDVEIGDNVVIMSGAIIGSSACLVGKDMEGNLMPLISAGKVKIGNNVQIGSYSTVSRGLFPYETSEIGDYSLIGFAVDLSHNSHIGKNVIVLDQSQVCGNTIIEDNVHISPQAIISNRLRIKEKADIAIGSVVVNNVKKGLKVAGNFAVENSKFLLWHKNKLRVK